MKMGRGEEVLRQGEMQRKGEETRLPDPGKQGKMEVGSPQEHRESGRSKGRTARPENLKDQV